MLHLINFDWEREGPQPERGVMMCLVEAQSKDEALKKLEQLCLETRLRPSSDCFANFGTLFIHSIVEISDLPAEGLIAFMRRTADPRKRVYQETYVRPSPYKTGTQVFSLLDENNRDYKPVFLSWDANNKQHQFKK
jgi:hypothetical protein